MAVVRRTDLGGLKARATVLFNRAIVVRDGACQQCGVEINLDCAHIFTSKRHATRWDPENAMALCRACHRWFTDHSNAWRDWLIDRLGQEKYDELKRRSLRAVPSWEVEQMARDTIDNYGGRRA